MNDNPFSMSEILTAYCYWNTDGQTYEIKREQGNLIGTQGRERKRSIREKSEGSKINLRK